MSTAATVFPDFTPPNPYKQPGADGRESTPFPLNEKAEAAAQEALEALSQPKRVASSPLNPDGVKPKVEVGKAFEDRMNAFAGGAGLFARLLDFFRQFIRSIVGRVAGVFGARLTDADASGDASRVGGDPDGKTQDPDVASESGMGEDIVKLASREVSDAVKALCGDTGFLRAIVAAHEGGEESMVSALGETLTRVEREYAQLDEAIQVQKDAYHKALQKHSGGFASAQNMELWLQAGRDAEILVPQAVLDEVRELRVLEGARAELGRFAVGIVDVARKIAPALSDSVERVVQLSPNVRAEVLVADRKAALDLARGASQEPGSAPSAQPAGVGPAVPAVDAAAVLKESLLAAGLAASDTPSGAKRPAFGRRRGVAALAEDGPPSVDWDDEAPVVKSAERQRV